MHAQKFVPVSSFLYFDLETVPNWDAAAKVGIEPLPDPPEPTPAEKCPPAEWICSGTVNEVKDRLASFVPDDRWLNLYAEHERLGKARAGALDAIESRRRQLAAMAIAQEEQRRLLSTTPELCRVVAAGVLAGDADEAWAEVVDDFSSERRLIDELWLHLARSTATIVGYHCLGFDLPVLFVRSALLDVAPTRRIDLRPFGDDVIDLYLARFGVRGNGTGRPGKLKELAAIHGIEVPAGDCDGSQVERLWAEDPAMLRQYQISDLFVTRALHRRYQGMFCR